MPDEAQSGSFYDQAMQKHESFGIPPTFLDVVGHILVETRRPHLIGKIAMDAISDFKKVQAELKENLKNYDKLLGDHASSGSLECRYMVSKEAGDGVRGVSTLEANSIYSENFADCSGVAILHPNGRALLHISPGVMRDGQKNVSSGDLHDQRVVRNPDYQAEIIQALYELATNQSLGGKKSSEEEVIAMQDYLQNLSAEERNKFLVVVSGHNEAFREMITNALENGGELTNKNDKVRKVPQVPVFQPSDPETAQWLADASAILVSKKGVVSIRPVRKMAKEIVRI